MAVLVEHGGHGGDVAAPLAMEIINNYFETVAPADREAPRVGLLRAAARRARRRRGPRAGAARRRAGRGAGAGSRAAGAGRVCRHRRHPPTPAEATP